MAGLGLRLAKQRKTRACYLSISRDRSAPQRFTELRTLAGRAAVDLVFTSLMLKHRADGQRFPEVTSFCEHVHCLFMAAAAPPSQLAAPPGVSKEIGLCHVLIAFHNGDSGVSLL